MKRNEDFEEIECDMCSIYIIGKTVADEYRNAQLNSIRKNTRIRRNESSYSMSF